MPAVEIVKVYADTVYVYRLTNMAHSSAKFGNCQVCNKHVSEVHLQTKYGQCKKANGKYFWADQGALWGHKDCVIGKRETGKKMNLKKFTFGNNSWEVEEQ
ncbi:MAG: hypothetical protein GY841_15785 [FCB group bacterium]|nr:hypothetical protein [FCB group bacterium]